MLRINLFDHHCLFAVKLLDEPLNVAFGVTLFPKFPNRFTNLFLITEPALGPPQHAFTMEVFAVHALPCAVVAYALEAGLGTRIETRTFVGRFVPL